MRHHAFITYHRASSARAARALQRRLQAVGRRNKLDSPLDIFLDETDLPISGLDETLRRELEASRRLIVVLHARTRQSMWVNREVRAWLETGGVPNRLILAKVDRSLSLEWDDKEGRFADEHALPKSLHGVFPAEPLWLNLPWRPLWGLVDRGSQIGRLFATLLDLDDPSTVLQVELKEQRRRQSILGGVLAVMSVLLVAAIVATVVAFQSRDEARKRESDAVAQAAAAEALLVGSERPDQSIDLLIDAANQSSSRAVRSAIFAVLEDQSRVSRVLEQPADFRGRGPDDVVFSPSGRRLAGWRSVAPSDQQSVEGASSTTPGAETVFALWDLTSASVIAEGSTATDVGLDVSFLGEDTLVFCGSEGVETVTLGPGRPARHETFVAGTDPCFVTPMQGGVIGAARHQTGTAEAVLLGADGESTFVAGVRSVAIERFDDVAFIHSDDGLHAFTADGRRAISLEPSDAPLGEVDILSVGQGGTVYLRAEDGRVLRSAAFEIEPAAKPLGIPDGALAVAEIAGPTPGHMWVTADDDLQWSLGPDSIDLTDLRGDPSSGAAVQPAIWLDEQSSRAVVAFAAGAAVLDLTLPPAVPAISRVENVPVNATWAGRTYLMDPLERGRDSVILPTAENSSVMVNGLTEPERFDGFGFFDPTGTVAVSFGDAPVRLFPGGSLPSEEISSAEDVRAVALSSNGTAMAVVRPAAPVIAYSTAPASNTNSIISGDPAPWQAIAAFGTRRFRATDGGQTVVAEDRGTITSTFEQLVGSLHGIHAIRPDGLAAVVAESQSFSVDRTDDLHSLDVTGGSERLPEACQPSGAVLRYLPGTAFRTTVSAAEMQQLTLVASSDDTATTPTVCTTADDPPEVAPADSILDYQVDDERGRIVARRDDGQIDITTWQLGDPTSLTSVVVPESGPDSRVHVSPSGRVLALSSEGSGEVAVLLRNGDRWTPSITAKSSVADVAAAIPDDSERLLSVVGSDGTVEAFELDTGQRLYERNVEVALPSGEEDSTVRWVAAERVDDAYVVRIGIGRSVGPIRAGLDVSAPMDIDVLRARLCDIHPTAEGCRD